MDQALPDRTMLHRASTGRRGPRPAAHRVEWGAVNMASTDLVSELQRLQLMVNAVRKAMRDDDTEAAKLLIGVTERLLMLSEVAEASALADEEVVQTQLRHVADLTDPG